MKRLAGRVAAITGGGSGIGRSTAIRFAEEGATVVTIDLDAKAAAATSEIAEQHGGTCAWYESDVSHHEAADEIANDIGERFGSLDVLVTAAGISVGKTVPDTLPEQWDNIFAVNVKGT